MRLGAARQMAESTQGEGVYQGTAHLAEDMGGGERKVRRGRLGPGLRGAGNIQLQEFRSSGKEMITLT